jgi:hypothetical protein
MMVLSAGFVFLAGSAFLTRPNLFAFVLCLAWLGAVLRVATGVRTRVGPVPRASRRLRGRES